MSAKDKIMDLREAKKRDIEAPHNVLAKSVEETRKFLPIYHHRDQLLGAMREHQVLTIVAETGSDNITHLPNAFRKPGYTKDGSKVGCTQPRRIAVDIARFRSEFRILISNATVDANEVADYFDGAPVVYIPGRRYSMDLHYIPQPTICMRQLRLSANDLIGFGASVCTRGPERDKAELTKQGRRMAEFPLDPMLSKAVFASEQHGTDELLFLCFPNLDRIFYRPKDKKLRADQARQNFVHPGGDHFTLLNLWE
ncbi:hypothetical protein Clacol_009950 [Clathrus columnatus]|uniref:Helicase-associated domain-containing protein n=1 Tax=Clathrus columnatus TaxID=1419009 RepID=A0AAV5APH3_9AGAM|nr:hypothetical protein Clacol_009950 [Clathrus columnatus]